MAKKSKNYSPWTISVLAFLFILLVVAFLGPGLSWLNKVQQNPKTKKEVSQEASVKFSFSPKSIYLKEGKIMSVDLILASRKEVRLDGADITLTFDPKILEVTEVVPSKVFSFASQKREKEREGKISVTFLEEKTNGVLIKDEVKLATLTIEGRAFGTGDFSVLSSDEGPTTVVAESGTSRKISFDSEKLKVVVY